MMSVPLDSLEAMQRCMVRGEQKEGERGGRIGRKERDGGRGIERGKERDGGRGIERGKEREKERDGAEEGAR